MGLLPGFRLLGFLFTIQRHVENREDEGDEKDDHADRGSVPETGTDERPFRGHVTRPEGAVIEIETKDVGRVRLRPHDDELQVEILESPDDAHDQEVFELGQDEGQINFPDAFPDGAVVEFRGFDHGIRDALQPREVDEEARAGDPGEVREENREFANRVDARPIPELRLAA